MSAPTRRVEQLADEIEALALKAIETAVQARLKVVKAIIGTRYPNGKRENFRAPLPGAAKLGIVYRTDPDPDWKITDPAALDDHLRTFPGNFVSRVVIAEDCMPEALAVLAEHAPHLLAVVDDLDPKAAQNALAQSRATNKPAAPGIEWVEDEGSLTVKPEKGAYELVGRLIAAKILTWDFRPALPESEAS